MKLRAIIGLALWAALAVGCGSDYRPPQLEASDVPAAPIGQVLDLEVALPNLRVMGAMFPGVELEVTFEIEGAGYGRHPARVSFGPARLDMRTAVVEDLTNGRVDVVIGPDAFRPGRMGPLRIEGTLFELLLNGEPDDGGWSLSGISWESQTGVRGTFQGWRRHRFLVAGTDFFSSVGQVAEVA